MKQHALTIDVVERETGVSKGLQRKREACCGFPSPSRDKRSHHQCSRNQVERPNLIKRLLLSGANPASHAAAARP